VARFDRKEWHYQTEIHNDDFFDLDDTLLDSESAHKVALEIIVDDYSLVVVPDEIFQEWIVLTDQSITVIGNDSFPEA